MNIRKVSFSTLVVLALTSAMLVSPLTIPPSTEGRFEHSCVLASSFDKLSGDLKREIEFESENGVFQVMVRLKDADLDGVPSSEVVDVLRSHARRTQAPVLEALQRRGDVVVLNQFWLVNAILVEAKVNTIRELAALPQIERIHKNFRLSLIEPVKSETRDFAISQASSVTWGLDKINAPEVWALGYTGTGVRVAVLDTGVDITHPDLAGKMWTDNPADHTYPGGWIEFNATGNIVVGSTPHDTDMHGTHCSGTILGGNASGTWIGVAPGATLMHALVLPYGWGTFAQVIAGMQWAIAPTDQYGNPAGQPADVVSMSFGAGGYHSELITPIRNMIAAGVVPVAAIGNAGVGTSGSPGNVYEAFGIGATDNTDVVAWFSGGERVYKTDWTSPPADWPSSWIKPDFSAPGVYVYSSVPGGGYYYAQGTSMATPHVAGTVALMLDVHPNLSVSEIYALLRDTAVDLGAAGMDIRYGWGRIDAYAAVVNMGIAILVSPADGENTNDNTPTFRWDNVVVADNWELWVDDDADFSSPVIRENTIDNTYTVAPPGLTDGLYYWRVRSYRGATVSVFTTRSFRVDKLMPTPLFPADGENTNDNTPTFRWDNVVVADNWELWVDDDPGFGSPAVRENTTRNFREITTQLTDGVYFWRVRGYRGATVSVFSSTRSLRVDTLKPVAPKLVSPSHGENTNDNTPTLSWGPVIENSLPVLYRVCVDNDPGFTSPEVDSGWISSTSYTTAPLVDGLYYWRVQARDNAGNVGDNSLTSSFRVDKLMPTPLFPADGENTNDNTPTFRWDNVVVADNWELWVDDDPGFGSPAVRENTTRNFREITTQLVEGVYYWRVRGYRGAGVSVFSPIRSFRVDITKPVVPTLLSPIPGENTNDNTTTLSWGPVIENSLPVLYRVYVDNDPGFTSPEVDSGWISSTSYTTAPLVDGLYYWRVQARDNAGNVGDNSLTRSFRVDTVPPATLLQLIDNFDDGDAAGWTLSGLWHVRSRRSWSPSYSLMYNEPADNNYEVIVGGVSVRNSGDAITLPISLPAATAWLSFMSWYETEDTGTTWDKKLVYISEDGGGTWRQVHQVSRPPMREWRKERVDLSPYVGKTILIKFRFDTVDNLFNAFEGWYIDDIKIEASAPFLISPADGQTISDNTPLLDWGPLDDLSLPILYRATVSRPSAFFDGFEDGNVDEWTTGGDNSWLVTTDTARSGSWSARSGAITHNQTSWIRGEVFGPSTLEFWWKVDSEKHYDYLAFYIDGKEMAKISGSVDWSKKTFSIPLGAHTIEWRYTKDFSISKGADRGWIDDVKGLGLSIDRDSGWLTGNQWEVTPALPNNIYYWRVQARDNAGNLSKNPPIRSFRVDTPTPAPTPAPAPIPTPAPALGLVPAPDFTMSVNPAAIMAWPGASVRVSVTVSTETGYNANVSLSAAGQPTGVDISFAPTNAVPNYTSIMTVTIDREVPLGTYFITVTGEGELLLVERSARFILIVAVPPLQPGKAESFRIENAHIRRMAVISKRLVENANISVRIVEPEVPFPPPYLVYAYIDFQTENLRAEDIEKVVIEFEVRRSWVEEKNIDPLTVRLNRFHAGSWHPLPTVKIGETKTSLYYSAESPGLSVFAITGEERKPPEPPKFVIDLGIVGAVVAAVVIVAVLLVWWKRPRLRKDGSS